jgi:AAA+ superfamily predicted ATPase
MTIYKNFKQTKPRSMHRVLSDIEFLIANNYENLEIILTDIQQLKLQLDAVKKAVQNRSNEIAFKIINPSINYYDNDRKTN